MTHTQEEQDWLDYFSGGVPTGEFFRMTLEDLTKIIDRPVRGMSRVNEVCFIGLVSYFEAFCKDHFASILSIEPALLGPLRDNGQDIQIDPARLLEFNDNWNTKLGFLVAEKFDFGTAQKINALYGALMKLTPFSKDEAKFYEGILRDRNLLVHHGGTFTLAYAAQTKLSLESPLARPFLDSLVVSPDYFDERLEFIKGIARKILKATHSALHAHIKNSGDSYSGERLKAVDAFLWWDDDQEI